MKNGVGGLEKGGAAAVIHYAASARIAAKSGGCHTAYRYLAASRIALFVPPHLA